jgi:hypothetical protein
MITILLQLHSIQPAQGINITSCAFVFQSIYLNRFNMEGFTESEMQESRIKLKAMHLLNGVKYLSEQQVTHLCYVVCHELGVEKTEENFNHVKDACKIYFDLSLTIIK